MLAQIDRRRDGEGGRRYLVSSSPPTTCSASSCSATPRASSRRPAARCSAARPIRSPAPPISPRFLLQAQASGAKVLGLCQCRRRHGQLHQAGAGVRPDQQMKLAALLMFISDVHALGLETAQGLMLTESFYWDLNDRTRAFTKRVQPKTPNNWPNMIQAGCYAGDAALPEGGAPRSASRRPRRAAPRGRAMKAMPTDDDAFGTTAPSARTAGCCSRPICSRSRSPPRARARGTSTSWWPPRRPTSAAVPLAEGGCSLVHSVTADGHDLRHAAVRCCSGSCRSG